MDSHENARLTHARRIEMAQDIAQRGLSVPGHLPHPAAALEQRVRHRCTRPCRPQTNGKAERFIQSALHEWVYGFSCQHSSERTKALDRWNHHDNWHRSHQGMGGAVPLSRLNSSRNNLLTLYS